MIQKTVECWWLAALLDCRNLNGLTEAEKSIVAVLMLNGYLTVDENGWLDVVLREEAA